MALPVVAFYLIFCYWPMYGAIIAFKNFSPALGILKSRWVGLENFTSFFQSIYFFRLLRNTLLINFYLLLFGFPLPILLAILLNELRSRKFCRLVQTASYLPHFISMMVICGIIVDFTRSDGVVNDLIALFGGARKTLLLDPNLFRTIYVSTDIWKEMGWGAIIYISAIAGIGPDLYEAAEIDGARRLRKILHITIPGILPTIVIMLILRIGQMMNIGYEKIILLYNPNTYETADVISSYVYRKGLLEFDYSYSTAVGLFNSGINFLLLVISNACSRKMNGNSLW